MGAGLYGCNAVLSETLMGGERLASVSIGLASFGSSTAVAHMLFGRVSFFFLGSFPLLSSCYE